LVGESGAGKSTVGRCLLRLVIPDGGRIFFNDVDIGAVPRGDLRRWRRRTQMVFQDPYDSLNPRWRVGAIVAEPLRLHTNMSRGQRAVRVAELLDRVRLPGTYADRYPRELSGGEAQRVAVARAIAANPGFLVLDEPTSSLDLSVRAGVLEVLVELQRDLGLTYLLISHDLATVAAYSDTVAVMYLGSILEHGPAESVFAHPQHPYTQALLSAALPADPSVLLDRHVLVGEIPSAVELPIGCLFASRCPLVRADCVAERPADRSATPGHHAACVRVDDRTNLIQATAVGNGAVP
jgi:oligopeptide/dipeptide ABC transporter ATP-binding protein